MRASSGSAHIFQPVEQLPAQSPEHAQLREMHVRVDEAGQQKSAAQIRSDGTFGCACVDCAVVAARGHAAVANQQPPSS